MHQEMNSICNTLKKKLDGRLSQKGILYRLFSRIKSRESVNKKIESKEYTEEGKNFKI